MPRGDRQHKNRPKYQDGLKKIPLLIQRGEDEVSGKKDKLRCVGLNNRRGRQKNKKPLPESPPRGLDRGAKLRTLPRKIGGENF